MGGIAHLTSAIAAHLREWEPSPPFVELAIFETSDPQRVAHKLNVFCEEVLGAHVVRGLFYQSSIGSVTGVALSDARSVVIKAHQPERSREHLTEIARVQNHLAEFGLFAPRLIAGPLPLARGLAMVEPFTNMGTTADAHRPEIRRALARSLRSIVTTCESLVSSTSLGPTLFSFANESLWPTPHSKLFDFAATGHGAEWIDEIAMRARTKMQPTGVRVIGHSDWRQEHVRFIGDAPVAGFDWDSLCCDWEPALVGSVANGFCADWSSGDRHRRRRARRRSASSAITKMREGKAFPRTSGDWSMRVWCMPAPTLRAAATPPGAMTGGREGRFSICFGRRQQICSTREHSRSVPGRLSRTRRLSRRCSTVRTMKEGPSGSAIMS